MTAAFNNMFISEAKSVIELLDEGFDTHAFITAYIYHFPTSYGDLLKKHSNVTTAHAEIANFLRFHSIELHLEKLEKNTSSDIFCNQVVNTLWRKCK